MIPQQWASPCGKQCTDKYAAITKLPCQYSFFLFHFAVLFFQFHSMPQFSNSAQISIFVGRVFCKKGCNSDGDTWEECKLYHFSASILLFSFSINQCFAFSFFHSKLNLYKLNELLSNCCHCIIACWILIVCLIFNPLVPGEGSLVFQSLFAMYVCFH
jgi:hypothetical protein